MLPNCCNAEQRQLGCRLVRFNWKHFAASGLVTTNIVPRHKLAHAGGLKG